MFAQFKKDSYCYYADESPSPLNDSNHLHLFNFLNCDLSRIPPLLDRFLTEQFDFVRMRLKDDRPVVTYNDDYKQALQTNAIINQAAYTIPDPQLQGILSILADSHPFYTMGFNSEMELEKIVVDGFNAKASTHEYVMDKKEYGGILIELLTVPPFLPCGYRSILFGEGKPDVEAYYKDYLETYKRYKVIRRMKMKGIAVTLPRLRILETKSRLNDLLIELLEQTPSVGEGYKQSDAYKFLIDLTVCVLDGVIYEQYTIGSLHQLLECEIYRMAIEKIKIKRCKWCNAYFVNDDHRKQYCDRRIIGDKTCQEIGPNRTYWNKRKDDDSYKALRKASSKNSMRLQRGVITPEQFKYWREHAEAKRKAGSDDFFQWLELSIAQLRAAYEFKS